MGLETRGATGLDGTEECRLADLLRVLVAGVAGGTTGRHSTTHVAPYAPSPSFVCRRYSPRFEQMRAASCSWNSDVADRASNTPDAVAEVDKAAAADATDLAEPLLVPREGDTEGDG